MYDTALFERPHDGAIDSEQLFVAELSPNGPGLRKFDDDANETRLVRVATPAVDDASVAVVSEVVIRVARPISLTEYRQTAQALEPGTIAQYRIELSSAVYSSNGYSPGDAWDPFWSEWSCDWKELAFI